MANISFSSLSRIVSGLGVLVLLAGPVYATLNLTFVSITDTEPVTANKWTASLTGNVLTVTPVNGTLDEKDDRIITITMTVQNTSANTATMSTFADGLAGITPSGNDHYDLWAGTNSKSDEKYDKYKNIFDHEQIKSNQFNLTGNNVTIAGGATETLKVTFRLHKNVNYTVSSGSTLTFSEQP